MMKAMRKWKNVENELPYDEGRVLAHLENGNIIIAHFVEESYQHWNWYQEDFYDEPDDEPLQEELGYAEVTHWIPLPKPPNTEDV